MLKKTIGKERLLDVMKLSFDLVKKIESEPEIKIPNEKNPINRIKPMCEAEVNLDNNFILKISPKQCE